ncbi:polyisoprenoid-binding protein [Aquabacterium lacunae]|uniref:Polyisoprenoid-binding protein n=1 Tax=Aquabacterium lacunae TaxID=2528630 RepID=A0A4V2JFK4_9BURK|nr:YceI family protein [Aquabacterium lacunae]TBO30280.1 polyisoprenoid-binding protein [Aquabacterium lacunae]
MLHRFVPRALCAAMLALGAVQASAAPVTYTLAPTHTFPSFEADHMGGVSVWRGKFNKSSGQVVLDKAAQTGSVEVTIDMNSIDYGLDIMNDKARSAELFDTAKYPTAVFKGQLAQWVDGKPTTVPGILTMRGVTRPITLKLQSFKCIAHPMLKGAELCGADALATLQRDEFGMDAGKDWGFDMGVTLRIQVEGVSQR